MLLKLKLIIEVLICSVITGTENFWKLIYMFVNFIMDLPVYFQQWTFYLISLSSFFFFPMWLYLYVTCGFTNVFLGIVKTRDSIEKRESKENSLQGLLICHIHPEHLYHILKLRWDNTILLWETHIPQKVFGYQ